MKPAAAPLPVTVLPTSDARIRAEVEGPIGRLIVAGPESGPVPLVVDLDRDLVREVLTAATTD